MWARILASCGFGGSETSTQCDREVGPDFCELIVFVQAFDGRNDFCLLDLVRHRVSSAAGVSGPPSSRLHTTSIWIITIIKDWVVEKDIDLSSKPDCAP